MDLDILVREDRLEQGLRALGTRGYVGPPSPEELLVYRHCHFHIPLRHPDARVVEIRRRSGRVDRAYDWDGVGSSPSARGPTASNQQSLAVGESGLTRQVTLAKQRNWARRLVRAFTWGPAGTARPR